jgi:hypothetical protein
MEVKQIITGYEPEYFFGYTYDRFALQWIYVIQRKDKNKKVVDVEPIRTDKESADPIKEWFLPSKFAIDQFVVGQQG